MLLLVCIIILVNLTVSNAGAMITQVTHQAVRMNSRNPIINSKSSIILLAPDIITQSLSILSRKCTTLVTCQYSKLPSRSYSLTRHTMTRATTSVRKPTTLHFHPMLTQLPNNILFLECYLMTCTEQYYFACIVFCLFRVTFIAFCTCYTVRLSFVH